MSENGAFLVSVRHNLVCEVSPVEDASGIDIPLTKLDVSAQLAASHRERGCIDGDYFFEESRDGAPFRVSLPGFYKKIGRSDGD